MGITSRLAANFFDGKSMQQYSTVAEQILFSACSMIASIVVVASAGVSWFGIYSFMFVISSFGNAFISTLLLRQMTLEISTLKKHERQSQFLATLAMMTVVFATIIITTVVVLKLLPHGHILSVYQSELVACELFVFFYSYFDAARQYLYVTDNHKNSFKYTLIYGVTLGTILLLIFLYSHPEKVVHRVFLAFSFSTIASLILNKILNRSIVQARWKSWAYVWSVFQDYFTQSRFRLVGLGVNWTQNHSFNPFLMLIAGPLVAGYFSLARLLVMPMPVVNQGLTNSAMPNLRRTFKSSGSQDLVDNIRKLDNKNLVFSALYVSLLFIAHITGLLNWLVPDYEHVKWFLLIWVLLILVSIHRFWVGQFFIVKMQFKYMMQVSLIALVVSLSGMLIMGVGFGKVYAALMFVIVGELVAIYIFKQKRKQDLFEHRNT